MGTPMKSWAPMADEMLAAGEKPAAVLRAIHGLGHTEVTAMAVYKRRERIEAPRTNVDASSLIRPEWAVDRRHAKDWAAQMLAHLARRMQGQPLGPTTEMHNNRVKALDGWLRGIAERDTVIDYDSRKGFIEVERRYWQPVSGWREPIDTFIKDPHRADDGTIIH